MVKLSDKQENLLAAVTTEKVRLDKALEALQARYEDEKLTLEGELWKAIKRAYYAKVPIRQIGLRGLGTKDYATWKGYLPVVEIDKADPSFVYTPVKPSVIPVDNDTILVRDSHKREWHFWLVNEYGDKIIERADIDSATRDLPVPAEVIEAVKEAYPDALGDMED